MTAGFGELLRHNHAGIISDWEEALAQAAAGGSSPVSLTGSTLRNHLPELLEIMRAHGGRVDVESSGEDGTTFTPRWPRRDEGAGP